MSNNISKQCERRGQIKWSFPSLSFSVVVLTRHSLPTRPSTSYLLLYPSDEHEPDNGSQGESRSRGVKESRALPERMSEGLRLKAQRPAFPAHIIGCFSGTRPAETTFQEGGGPTGRHEKSMSMERFAQTSWQVPTLCRSSQTQSLLMSHSLGNIQTGSIIL